MDYWDGHSQAWKPSFSQKQFLVRTSIKTQKPGIHPPGAEVYVGICGIQMRIMGISVAVSGLHALAAANPPDAIYLRPACVQIADRRAFSLCLSTAHGCPKTMRSSELSGIAYQNKRAPGHGRAVGCCRFKLF